VALLLDSDAAGTLSLADFIAELDDYGSGLDEDALVAVRHSFKRLLNNRTMLADSLAAELLGAQRFQSGNPWVGSSFVLWRTPIYTIRANTWNPPQAAEAKKWENDLYSYHIVHDHNFAFLTGGYHGCGYRTLRYEYDPEETPFLRVGDRPKTLVESGPAYLAQGELMLYRESRDVHIQEYPAERSISINVMIQSRRKNPQILLDRPDGAITGLLRDGDDLVDTVDRLSRIFAV
jgi:hypothetical protein